MHPSQGRSIRLFLVGGSSLGLITAEIMSWTGHLILGPRSRVGDILSREECTRTGIYFLVGPDPEQASLERVYIGEADIVGERIKQHATDPSKEFWSKACLVTSKDYNLTKAHARYLESRLVEIARKSSRYNVANGNVPARKTLPESDVADMENFISQLELILPVVGFQFLQEYPPAGSPNLKDRSPTTFPVELSLTSDKYGISASALIVGEEITVLKGSQASKAKHAHNTYAALREQLIKDGILVDNGKHLLFSKDFTFKSPSPAAAVVNNRNSNGRTDWRITSTGETLKDWQDAQVK